LTLCRQIFDLKLDEECLKTELDLLDNLRENAKLGRKRASNDRSKYNAKVKLRNFHNEEFVWQIRGDACKEARNEKFVPKWEGLFRVRDVLHAGAFRLEQMDKN